MKLLSFFLIIWMPFSGFFNSGTNTPENPKEKINWLSIEQALKKNEEEPKKIMIDFYTDWCGYCKKLDRVTFSHPQIAEYINKNFYAVKFDAESGKTINYLGKKFKSTPSRRAGTFNGTHEFAYYLANDKGRIGYPTIAFLDEDSSKITHVPSYLGPVDMDKVLRFIGENFYKSTSYNIFERSYKSRIR